jgi:hypothetical protein
MLDILVLTIISAAGYAASIYSWPWVRTRAIGISAEAANLRQRAAALDPHQGDRVMWAAIRLKLKGWKTMAAAALYGAAGAALELHDTVADLLSTSGVDWKQAIDPKYVPWLLIGTGVMFGLLRIMTRGPIGHKGDAEPAPNAKAEN